MLAEFVRSFRAEEFGERNTEVITDVMPGKKIGEVFVKRRKAVHQLDSKRTTPRSKC